MEENNVFIYIASNAGSSEKDIRFICHGLEEESIPFKVVEKDLSDSKQLAEYASNLSKLEIGVGLDKDGYSCIASNKYLDDFKLFYKKRMTEEEFKNLGKNSARLLKGIPFTIESE